MKNLNTKCMVALATVCLTLLSGCTYIGGMTEYDKQSQDAGLILHCTEVTGDKCLTTQWVQPGEELTYRRYHE